VTAAILVGVLAVWLAARRWPTAAGRAGPLLRRWWWMGCGIAWLIVLEPAGPGLVLLVVGAWLALPRAAADESGDATAGSIDSTLTFVAD
jgi:hypothetical protein